MDMMRLSGVGVTDLDGYDETKQDDQVAMYTTILSSMR